MASTTLSVRVDSAEKERLGVLAKSTGRSSSFLAADAIKEYLAVNEWQVAGIKAAIASIDANGGVAHENVQSWVESWTSPKEIARPKSRKV